MKKNAFVRNRFFINICAFLFFTLYSCIDPVAPEFDFVDDLVFIEGFASTSKGTSFATVKKSVLNRGRYSTMVINDAKVSFKNTNTGTIVPLTLEQNSYIPPSDFVASVGASWELHVVFSDGTEYRSTPETIVEPVSILNLKANYNPELIFRDDSEKFVPGHSISVTFDDPVGTENYYYWSYRAYEKISTCITCIDGIFRNGICEKNPELSDRQEYYDYFCASNCWKIRYNENIKIFADKFSDGATVNELPIADVLLYSKENVSVEIQQFSLSPSAHEYYQILKDIVDNSSGFNAPPPAALIGNLFNLNNKEEVVLGRFTAAATISKSIFIERKEIAEPIVGEESSRLRIFESCVEVCPPEACRPGHTGEPCSEVTGGAPCKETRFRTGITPQGWIEQ